MITFVQITQSITWRLDAIARAWFGLRVRFARGWILYGLIGGATLLGLCLMIGPSWLGAPTWLSYPLVGVGAIVVIVSHVALVLRLDAAMTALPMLILRWMSGNPGAVGMSLPQPTDHREQAAACGWRVPASVGQLEGAFLRFRLRGSINSQLTRMQLGEVPGAAGRQTSRRL